ncbi:LysR family transcriptional regulator [Brachybacterium sp. JHP9]|uniref:LysR family transcriptional regulator n=2 Tax=Brachybacterium equifaecis TaxID=2910770 RepID=A0ABT0QXD4_9MICO|nr:LysR family transcriptional regulator [Brachybacterium equifaecis]MCL6421808.1 LysR family transcriptional regulator [Brachybacterium equifaecis]
MRRWKTAPRTAWLELHPLALSEQLSALAEGRVDMCFVRLPLMEGAGAQGAGAQGTDAPVSDSKGVDPEATGAPAALTAADLHIVPLWEEQPVALMGDEHLLSLHGEILLADLEGETEILPRHLDDAEERVEVAATGAGFTRLPLSLARLHHRKDAVHRVITDAEPTQIAIVWPRAADDDARQEFVGTVRGRTGRSGRNGG